MNSNQNRSTWNDETRYWRENFQSRPYAKHGNGYEYYEPGYRYGFEASRRYEGRTWKDVEADLAKGWEQFAEKGASTWAQVKEAAHDAWDRVTGREHAHA